MEKTKLIKPDISFEELESELKGIFQSGQLTKGKHVASFTEHLREYTGAEHAFLTTSATTALSMCLKVLGVQRGDKVAVADFSFPATANVVEDLEAKPVFIDVCPDTFNMCEKDLRKKLSREFSAVIFVDTFGNPSGLNSIKRICQEFEVPLIEDAACAIGSVENELKVGNIADLTCFSFHPRKLLTTGEGGAILTNNAKYAEILEVKLNHGAKGMAGKGLNFVDFGFNYRMSEIQALMGWKQLIKLDSLVNKRNEIAEQYDAYLSELGFKRQIVYKGVKHNVQSVVFRVPEGISRDALIDYLKERNIESTIGTYCLSNTQYYKEAYGNVQPSAVKVEQSTITLPCFDGVQVREVCEEIRTFCVSR